MCKIKVCSFYKWGRKLIFSFRLKHTKKMLNVKFILSYQQYVINGRKISLGEKMKLEKDVPRNLYRSHGLKLLHKMYYVLNIRRRFFLILPIRNKKCPWQPCFLKTKWGIFVEDLTNIISAKYQLKRLNRLKRKD